jgi:hypothetical protein
MEVNKEKLLEIIKEADNCMEYHPETDKPEYYSFKLDAITDEKPVYRALSDIVYNADVSTNFAYQMVAEVIDALEYIISNEDETIDTDNLSDQIAEQADSNTPIYNSEIMEFVSENPCSVDDAINEMGKSDSLIGDGQMAYYLEWEKIAYSVLNTLAGLLDD